MITLLPLTVGPIVGHADINHVRIWGRAKYEFLESGRPRRTFGAARFRKKGEDKFFNPQFFKMNPNFDMSGLVVFNNLKKNTKYNFEIGYFSSELDFDDLYNYNQLDWENANIGEFQTASDDPMLAREFIFGSCRYLLKLLNGSWFDDRGDKTFRSILKQLKDGRNINKFLMIGDQIYADDLNFIAPDIHVEEYLSRYRDAFSQPFIKQLMSRVSTYMTLDDHEIEDNWPSKAVEKDFMVKYPAAMHAYQTYQMSHSPLLAIDSNGKLSGISDRYYYQFFDGCCEFFVTDTRTERNLSQAEIISPKQMSDLLMWLENGSGKVKFIVSSVLFFPDTVKESDDQWSNFKHQRDEIISHIQKNRVKKVVFLSGDVHCSMAAEIDISENLSDPLRIYSIVSSSFYWPYPHPQRTQFQLTGSVASENDDGAYKLVDVSDVYSGDNFTRVLVSSEKIKIEVYERKGELKHTKEFKL